MKCRSLTVNVLKKAFSKCWPVHVSRQTPWWTQRTPPSRRIHICWTFKLRHNVSFHADCITKRTQYHSSSTCSAHSLQYGLLLGGIFGFFGIGSNEDGKKVPPSIKRQLLKAQRALRNGPDYDKAERAYHKALELLSTSVHSSSQVYQEARAVTLDKLANLYLEQEKLDMAEVTFKEALRVMITAGLEQNDDAVVEISYKLSKLYTNLKRYDLASAGFTWCVTTARDNLKQNETENGRALLGMCLHGEGQYYLVVGENNLATAAFGEALEIARQVYGDKHLQVAVLHNDLATSLDRLGEYTQAEHLVRKSIEITESLEGVRDDVLQSHLFAYYFNFATIQYHNGSFSIAEESFNRALKIIEKIRIQNSGTSQSREK